MLQYLLRRILLNTFVKQALAITQMLQFDRELDGKSQSFQLDWKFAEKLNCYNWIETMTENLNCQLDGNLQNLNSSSSIGNT